MLTLAYLLYISHSYIIMEQNKKTAIDTLEDRKFHRIITLNNKNGFCCFEKAGQDSLSLESDDYLDDLPEGINMSLEEITDGLILVDDHSIECLEVEVLTDGFGAEIDSRNRTIEKEMGMVAIYSAFDHKNPITRLPVSLTKIGNTSYLRGEKE